ncbi:hypothetical protein P5673_020918 [Acropora cervicornis]|uniref:Uncharacterized protein n=1 Tax=Acropora cervicornis TaxID=6130 RepID=A0AAD9V0V2_ACRCE|nr:hypothetical protein P5673_020918 [Acropora cervicornis]
MFDECDNVDVANRNPQLPLSFKISAKVSWWGYFCQDLRVYKGKRASSSHAHDNENVALLTSLVCFSVTKR